MMNHIMGYHLIIWMMMLKIWLTIFITLDVMIPQMNFFIDLLRCLNRSVRIKIQ